MTDADYADFSTAIMRLADRLGGRAKLTATAIAETFGDLRGFPLSVIERGLDECRRTCRYFPTPKQVIDACGEASRARAFDGGDVPAWVNHDADPPVYFCRDCDDSGFVRRMVCAGDGQCRLKGCGVLGSAREPHDYTARCQCRSTNPVLARQRAAMRRPTQEHAS